MARGDDFRVKLTDGPGGGIARIGEYLLALFRALLIYLLQCVREKPPLPFNDIVSIFSQAERNRLYCTDICCDIFSDKTVSAGRRSFQNAFFISEHYFETVYLELGDVSRVCGSAKLLGKDFFYPRIKLTDFFF